MSDETSIVTTSPAAIQPLNTPDGDVVVLARNPEEMADAQQGLISWAEQKVRFENQQLAETEENLGYAKKMKHRTAPWARQVKLASNRVKYYEKTLAALKEGYCIVPNFPVQVIATRTKKRAPKKQSPRWRGTPMIAHEQLPIGEGDYVDPTPRSYSTSEERTLSDGRTTTDHFIETTGVHNQVDFPFKTVKPQIMSDFSRASALKIFDDIGVLPAQVRNADPMLIGRILRRNPGGGDTVISFLITWWIDTRDLG